MFATRPFVFIAVTTALLAGPACNRKSASDRAPESGPRIPCAIESRPLTDESATFVPIARIEAASDGSYLLRRDTNADGAWDTCIRSSLASAGLASVGEQVLEIDPGCDGTVDHRRQYRRDGQVNLIDVTDDFGDEATLIVSAVATDFVLDTLALTLVGPRSNFAFEFDDDGRLTTLIDHGKHTRLFYDRSGRILKAQGEDGSIVAYEYDGAGRMLRVHWFKRDVLLRLLYTCD
jgi:YD repeat-containing protein